MFHRDLGKILWDLCGMARNEAGLQEALRKIPQLRQEFWEDVCVLGEDGEINQSLEKAGRVADFLELGELLCRDALERRESAGAHFREEFQTPDGEAERNDDDFCHVAAWEYTGDDSAPDPPRRAPRPSNTSRSRPGVTSKWRPPPSKPRPCRPRAPPGTSRTPRSTSPSNVWRQKNREAEGRFVTYDAPNKSAPTCRSWRCSTSSTRS